MKFLMSLHFLEHFVKLQLRLMVIIKKEKEKTKSIGTEVRQWKKSEEK